MVNNDLKYALQGFLLTLLLIFSIRIITFLSSIDIKNSNDQQTANTNIRQVTTTNIKNTKGRTLFSQNCASCHAINKTLTGPALAGVEDRVTDKKLLHDWIHNNQKVLRSGNSYFNALYTKFNNTQMNLFPNLSDEDIDNILAYIKEASTSLTTSLPIASAYLKAH